MPGRRDRFSRPPLTACRNAWRFRLHGPIPFPGTPDPETRGTRRFPLLISRTLAASRDAPFPASLPKVEESAGRLRWRLAATHGSLDRVESDRECRVVHAPLKRMQPPIAG